MTALRGPDVCDLVGITYRQLDYWARTDLIRPSLVEAKGSGTRRVYSMRDALLLAIVHELVGAGLSLPAIRRSFSTLRGQLPDDPAAWDGLLVVWTSRHMDVVTVNDLIDVVLAVEDGPLALLSLGALARRITDRDTTPRATGEPVTNSAS